VTDDTAAIQAALTYLSYTTYQGSIVSSYAKGGGTLIFPPGDVQGHQYALYRLEHPDHRLWPDRLHIIERHHQHGRADRGRVQLIERMGLLIRHD
jgi:hypothetical protein